MKVQKCKGTQDLMPKDMAKFLQIEGRFRDCCQQWGYQEIRTPTLEYLHLFTSAGALTADMLGRVYSFLDWDGWSGERVVLRPEGTIPAARLYVENMESQPGARLFYIENMFAFERPGTESRERWQCGAELVGSTAPEGDVELIMLALEVLSKMGIGPVEVGLSHAGVIKAFLKELGLSGEESTLALDQILNGDTSIFNEIRRKTPDAEKSWQLLFGLKGNSASLVENMKAALLPSHPALGPSLDNLACLARLLTDLGCKYEIDFASGRGFEYYTGAMFSFYRGGRRLGRGGRYDELVPLIGGKSVSASGFALYAGELMHWTEEPPKRDRILVRATGTKAGFEIAGQLRNAGYVAELDLGWQQDADFRWVVRVGEKGLELTDQITCKKTQRASAPDVVGVLREAGCK